MRARIMSSALLTVGAMAISSTTAVAAPELALNRTCYLSGGVVSVSGSGFAANVPVNVAQNGTVIGSAQTDATGAFTSTFNAPTVGEGARASGLDVTANDGISSALATTKVSAFNADFSPSSGNPRTLKVRFVADGFNLLSAQPSTVYMHYIAPDGKRKVTKRLGVAQGVCGSITAPKRKLFPFSPRRGVWKIQWDTQKRYTKCTRASTFLCFVREVRVYVS